MLNYLSFEVTQKKNPAMIVVRDILIVASFDVLKRPDKMRLWMDPPRRDSDQMSELVNYSLL